MKCLTITTEINQYKYNFNNNGNICLQDLITEKNVELQEFIKEQMRVHQLSNLSIDQRELMIDTPAITNKAND